MNLTNIGDRDRETYKTGNHIVKVDIVYGKKKETKQKGIKLVIFWACKNKFLALFSHDAARHRGRSQSKKKERRDRE